MKWTIKQKHEGFLIRDYLLQVQNFSRRMLKSVKFDGGQICVNDSPKTVRYCLKADDQLAITFPVEERGPFMVPEEIPLDIVYEDEDVVVLNKQPGVAVIPSSVHPIGTIANGLLAHYVKNNIPYTIHTVTRLDRDTSGLMLIAKHRYSHSILSVTQQSGKIKRNYKAVVEGHLSEKEGTINQPIGRKEGSIIERIGTDDGKPAVTHYKVIQETTKHSLVDISLETGRTHQIRVHFSYIGHPLAGDDLYGGTSNLINRQALHCEHISFNHPFSGKEIHFSSSIPDDVAQNFQVSVQKRE